jgi:hypothetical protein
MEKHSKLSMGEFLLWASAEFAVAGWMITKIQKEKNTNHNEENPQ